MPVRVFSQEEIDDLRTKMLNAGFPLLKQYGMTHTSISKITNAAGIGVSTFYNFWKSKEEYMSDLILYHRKKMLPRLVPPEVLKGERKLRRDEVRVFFKALTDEDLSIYPHMTLEDESRLIDSSDRFKPDIRKESAITAMLLEHFENVREDPDLGLIANLTKILALSCEYKDRLHSSSYDKTIDRLVESILDLIFKE